MLVNCEIYKKYASLEDYQRFVDDTLQNLQPIFPQVKLRSFGEFKAFLDGLVPKLVHKYLILSGTMKNCSGVSPDFAEIASQAGFPTVVELVPGHQYNIVLTTEGPYMVDLSYIQFTCKHDWFDEDSREEVLANYRDLYKNPFKAIKIEKLPHQYYGGTRLPNGEYNSTSPDPMKSITRYNPQKMEEIYPERFNKLK